MSTHSFSLSGMSHAALQTDHMRCHSIVMRAKDRMISEWSTVACLGSELPE